MKSWKLVVGVACLIAVGASCKKSPEPVGAPDAGPMGTRDSGAASLHTLLPATDVVQGASIYPLKPKLVDQDGNATNLDVYRGKVVLIAMFYSSCPFACPTLISHLKQIDAAVSPDVLRDTRVLLVSFDPANDTPPVLSKLAAERKSDLTRWKFATAPDDQVREIAAVLGIKYRQADGSFNHSSVITILDREGKIDLRAGGLADDTDAMVRRLTELVHSAPTTAKTL